MCYILLYAIFSSLIVSSLSYRKAQKRLRKLGRPEIDISSDRLKLRPNIEKEIDQILQSNGFEKVSCCSPNDRTEWNRSIELYERKRL